MGQATILTEAEQKKVLKVISVSSHSQRNRAAFLLSAWAGLRVGEISALKVGDVVNADGSIAQEIKLSKSQTKGDKARLVFLNDKLRKELALYVRRCRALLQISLLCTHSVAISIFPTSPSACCLPSCTSKLACATHHMLADVRSQPNSMLKALACGLFRN